MTQRRHKSCTNTLGLRSVLERVAALGGRIEVASAVGHGTQVTLLLPATAAHGDAAPHHPSKGN